MSIKFLLLGGVSGGGGSADFIFMGARIFLREAHLGWDSIGLLQGSRRPHPRKLRKKV